MFYLRKDSIINNFKKHQPKTYRNCVNAVKKAKYNSNTYYLNKASFKKRLLNLLIMQFLKKQNKLMQLN